ncbi:S8 family serine peptidase [Aminiphilus sp.]|jgi:subtilisin family serine protease|uniref:S8 family peptidase n=1 Tax=Aminiphilus sp. TaxID=1872488 RepID=UPI002606C8C1|nr:S8 family serine peptidase [Aminiphilus sp.]
MRCALSLFLLFLIAGVFSSSAFAAAPRLSADDPVVRKALASLEGKRILVELRVPEGLVSAEERKTRISVAQEQVLVHLESFGVNAEEGTVRRYETFPFLAMSAPGETGMKALAASSLVKGIYPDRINLPSLKESVPLIGGTTAQSMGATGEGYAVAILDTGVDLDHPFLKGRIVGEGCYSTHDPAHGIYSVCPNRESSSIVPGSGNNCDLSIIGCNHGTHVAGIAAGNGNGGRVIDFSGVAPLAGIVAIQVFCSQELVDTETGEIFYATIAFDSDIIAGIERVLELSKTIQIAAVNLSLGGSEEIEGSCDLQNPAMKTAFDALRAAGIAPVVAAGNEGFSGGINMPACLSNAVSVGAVTKNDEIAVYSNSSAYLTLLAPGGQVWHEEGSVAPADDGGIVSSVPVTPDWEYMGFDGTSMATPHVAGAFAALRSRAPNADVDTILDALRGTGKGIYDNRNGVTVPRIRVDNALAALTGDAPPSATPTTDPGSGGGCTVGAAPSVVGAVLCGLLPLLFSGRRRK